MAPSQQADRPRIVVTGVGAVTNLGLDATSTWDAMVQGKSGARPITGDEFAPWTDAWDVRIAGQILDFDPAPLLDKRAARRIDRFAQLGLCATAEAIEHSGLDLAREDTTRCGVVIGSGIGGIQTIETGVQLLMEKGPSRISPFTVPRLMVNACAGLASIRWGLRGPSSAHATACASSGHSIGDAMRIIQRGEADVMLAGGAEAAVSPICVAAFAAMRALTTRNDDPTKASRPFDRDRDGFLLAEGAGVLVLESEHHATSRGATILAELAGYGASSDAAHITAPDPAGDGAIRSMHAALTDAGVTPTDIDYINAHGTSTPLGDAAEIAAVHAVFGDHARTSAGGSLRMSSTKSMHGHCLGASGGVEMVACLGAIRHGVVPPTINLDHPDDGFDINLTPHTAVDASVTTVMNNTFGFGGHNVTLIIRRYDA